MQNMRLNQIHIQDAFWDEYLGLIRDVVIPYQYGTLNDLVPGVAPSHAVKNFKIACGEETGEFGGMVFQDSDIYKWLEAVGYSLETNPNPALEQQADELIALIEKAQQPDGYVNTYYQLKDGLEKRFTNLQECHELYCLGHMIEAAIAYYAGTGKSALLEISCRFADLVHRSFGPEEGKIQGYPGHQEIELALVKLYTVTKEARYLELAQYFLDERGKQPAFFTEEWERRGRTSHWSPGSKNAPELAYNQAHLPVREQDAAVGHAVRAVYMYTGMAMTAKQTGDASLLAACKRLWQNIVDKQLYITGGIGQTSLGEAFTFDYDLPNDTVYSETCAAIGLIFFARAMLDNEQKGSYADVMEQALYNTVLGGMAKDGKHFFYVNPLEVWPQASEKAPVRRHVLAERPGWFSCACCPPNVARLLTSLGGYIYTVREKEVDVNLYIGGTANLTLPCGNVTLQQTTNFPWNGDVEIAVTSDIPADFTISLRIPGWCEKPTVTVNGEAVDVNAAKNGFLPLQRSWQPGDVIRAKFPMEIQVLRANCLVRENAGKAAVTRGPLTYCIEQADNGENLSRLSLNIAPAQLASEFNAKLCEGAVEITASGTEESLPGNALYIKQESTAYKPCTLRLIPYFLWGNRGKGEMAVWIRTSVMPQRENQEGTSLPSC